MSDIIIQHKPTFASAARPFVERGGFPQNDLLPIIPPGAKIASQSAVDHTQAGKVPGRYEFRTGEWWGLTGDWPTVGLTDRLRAQAASWPTQNVGLRAEQWPAIDIDVARADVRDVVENLVNFHLGHSPIRERAGAPRALCVFRLKGEEAIRKMRLVFRDDEGTEHAVEVLGAGQQYVISGTHPSGVEYQWREGAELSAWGARGLTQISAAEVSHFMDVLSAEVQGRGWEIVRDVRLRRHAQGLGYDVADLDPMVPVEMALAALRTIPNTEDVLPMREDIVGVIASFRAATGRESMKPEVEAAVREWATEQDWADDNYFDGVWRSLKHVRIGPTRLFGLAHTFGFIADAQEDFKADTAKAEEQIVVAKDAADEQTEKVANIAKRLVYWTEAQQWIVRDTGAMLSHSALNSSFGLGTEIAPAGATGVRAASNILVNSGLVPQVMGTTYLPGKPPLATWTFNGRSAMYYNRWTDVEHKLPEAVTDDDVRPWLDHVEYLFDTEEDREYLLDFLAHTAQQRGRKIRWAPLIIGNQGVGKDLFMRPLLMGLAHNAQTVAPRDLLNRFIDFYEKELVVVEEMLRFEKNDVYEQMKAIISGTASDTITIEKKFRMPYEIPNIVNFVFFSNHNDALHLSHDDRRFFVINSHATARDDAYYTRLADDFYINEEGWKAVWVWLKQRDIAAFNPNHRPRMTDDKLAMITESQPPYVLWLTQELASGQWKGRSVLTIPEILDRLGTDFGIPEHVRRHMKWPSQITEALRFAGWHRRSKQIRLNNLGQRPWCRTKELAESDTEMLRARFKAEVEKKVTSVG